MAFLIPLLEVFPELAAFVETTSEAIIELGAEASTETYLDAISTNAVGHGLTETATSKILDYAATSLLSAGGVGVAGWGISKGIDKMTGKGQKRKGESPGKDGRKPNKLRMVDSGIDGASSEVGDNWLGQLFSNDAAPDMDTRDGPGGGGPAGSTGGGPAPVPAHKWDNHQWGSTTTTHSYAGTFFLKDDRAHTNDWVQFPWEYLYWWRNPEVMAQARKSRYYRTKYIKIKFKNPSQTYGINQDSSLINAGQNGSAKVTTWLDTDYIAGPSLQSHNWDQRYTFIEACQNDGFGAANAAYFLQPVQFNNQLLGPRSSWRSCKQVGANTTQEFDFSWKIDHKKGDWRSTSEFIMNHGNLECNFIAGETKSAQGIIVDHDISDAEAINHYDWRLDNYMCKYMHPRWNLQKRYAATGTDDVNQTDEGLWENVGYVAPPIPGCNPAVADALPMNDADLVRFQMAHRHSKVIWGYSQPAFRTDYGTDTPKSVHNGNNFLYKFGANNVPCHGPIPTLWLGVQNQIGADLSSLQLQCVQLQFEMEVAFEWSGGMPSNIKTHNPYNGRLVQNNCPIENMFASRVMVVPFYPLMEKGSAAGDGDKWDGITRVNPLLPSDLFQYTVHNYEEMGAENEAIYGIPDRAGHMDEIYKTAD